MLEASVESSGLFSSPDMMVAWMAASLCYVDMAGSMGTGPCRLRDAFLISVLPEQFRASGALSPTIIVSLAAPLLRKVNKPLKDLESRSSCVTRHVMTVFIG